jgi:osmoprotectant transport system ATP-binding protein
VARFIGLGRGYRWLQLIDAAGLPLHDVERVYANGLSDPSGAQLSGGWAVVVDDDGAPLGWIDAEGLRRHRGGAPLSDSMSGIGSLFRPDGNLSQALDAALSSPSALGLAVDGVGKVIGGVLAADVLAAAEAQRRG